MGTSLTALLGYDVIDPRSPHSVHVTSEADVPAIGPWGHDYLHRAVRVADERDAVVVLDHGRDRLYLAAPDALHYRPPGAFGLGFGDPPALVVDAPQHLRPDGDDLAVEAFDPALLETPPPAWPAVEGDSAPDAAPSEADTPADDSVGDADDGRDADPDPVTDGGTPRDGDPSDSTGEDPVASETPDGTGAAGRRSVTVSPAFDVLVPAFDIETQGEPAEPLPRHAVESPSGVGTGTPSG